jgi:hypothetical protein
MAQRERTGARGQRLDDWQHGPTKQREEGRAGEETSADILAPLCRERVRESARARELSHLSGGAGAWPGWTALPFSFFLNFLIAFPFLFSRVLNSNSNQVSNSN